MREKHLGHAVSSATILSSTREQFARALRDAAMASIRARSRGAGFDQPIISRYFLESHVDDALYLIGRDGLDALESNGDLFPLPPHVGTRVGDGVAPGCAG